MRQTGGGWGQSPVVVLAPTGIAACLVQGNTIHSALGISPEDCHHQGVARYRQSRPLPSNKRAAIEVLLQPVTYIIIDEISKVSKQLDDQIDSRLK